MKRLVETDRWKDRFFIELHPNAKLLLSYLYDNANEAGFIDIHYSLMSTQLKMDKELIIISLKALQSVLLSDKKKKIFIKDFLKHQNKIPLIKGIEEHDWIIDKLQSNVERFNNSPEILNILNNHVTDPNEIKAKGKPARNKTFVVPTFEELKAYYLKEKPNAELSAIKDVYDHYVSVGWVVGKSRKPVVDWEACVRTSIRNEEKFGKSGGNRNYAENKKSRTEATLSAVDEIKRNN